jgi:hypothetical protein
MYLRPVDPRSKPEVTNQMVKVRTNDRSKERKKGVDDEPQLPPKSAAHSNEEETYLQFFSSIEPTRRMPARRREAAFRQQSGAGNSQRQARSEFIVWAEFFTARMTIVDVPVQEPIHKFGKER